MADPPPDSLVVEGLDVETTVTEMVVTATVSTTYEETFRYGPGPEYDVEIVLIDPADGDPIDVAAPTVNLSGPEDTAEATASFTGRGGKSYTISVADKERTTVLAPGIDPSLVTAECRSPPKEVTVGADLSIAVRVTNGTERYITAPVSVAVGGQTASTEADIPPTTSRDVRLSLTAPEATGRYQPTVEAGSVSKQGFRLPSPKSALVTRQD